MSRIHSRLSSIVRDNKEEESGRMGALQVPFFGYHCGPGFGHRVGGRNNGN